MKIVALDFETSGLDAKRHAPVSLGVALMEAGEVLASEEWVIAPPMKDGKITREYDVCALEISGHKWSDIKKATAIGAVCSQLGAWCDKHDAAHLTVVAFNAPFDFGWYSELLFMGGSWNQHLRRFETFKPPLIGPWQCARLIAATSLDLDRYSLDSVSAHFGLARTGETHGALEDAVLAGKVYHRLTAKTEAVAS